jgi:ubiquinol-cytochrome c reductase cytochrome c subunit
MLETFTRTVVTALLTGAVAVANQAPPVVPVGNVEDGKKLYVKNGCAGCHGIEGQGAPTSGPRIGPNPLPVAAFIKYVRAPKNQMPPYTGKVMSDEDLTDVRAFLAARPKPAAATVLAP